MMHNVWKRISLTLFLSLGMLWGAFSANIWVDRFDTSTTIDLGSTDFWFPTGTWSSSPTRANGMYGDKQMAAVIGIQGSSEVATVTFSSDWYLTSTSDPSLKRPFSLCLVPRVNHSNFPNKNSSVYPRYGYQGQVSASFTLPKTDGSRIMTDGVNIVSSNGSFDYGNVTSAWMDVVFVLDPVLNQDGTLPGEPTSVCNVAPGDDYVGQVIITVQSGNMVESSVFNISGYFGTSYAGSGSSAQLVVTPDIGSTNAFHIVDNQGVPVKIADIEFTTSSARSMPNDYYLFVSSSPYILGTAAPFEFRRRGSTGASNSFNSCTYEIIPTAITGTVPARAFTGDMVFNSSTTTDWMKAETTAHETGNGWGTIYNTTFQGDLYLRVTGNVANLLAGAYETNIYIHVITSV